MTVDAFLYNGEDDLLDLRVNILNDYVDEFVVVEAPQTFRGKPKDLFFKGHANPKVKYHVVDINYTPEELEEAKNSPNTGGQYPWIEEYLQREAIKKALAHLKDDDTVFVSDCDEIWKPAKYPVENGVKKLVQLNYCYYLNNRIEEPWAGTFVGKWKDIKNKSLNELRASTTKHLDKPETWDNTFIDNAGWHFSNCMSKEDIIRKFESFSHEEFDNDNAKRVVQLARERLVDFTDRNRRMWIENENLPKYLLENKEKYKHLCK